MNLTKGRYSRQELFAPFGETGQTRLRAARVGVFGCGGLGSNVIDILARAGVGTLRIVDRDIVELSNLQRQSLFDERDVAEGLPKALAAKRRVGAINSEVCVEAHAKDVNSGNILGLLDRVDLAIDGFDNFEGRYLLNDACVAKSVPWVHGACLGSVANAGLVVPGLTPCLRCLHRDLPPPGSAPTCDTAGIIGPAAWLAAALEAALALRWLASGNAPAPAILSADVWEATFDRFDLPPLDPNAECPCCMLRHFEFLAAPVEPISVLCGQEAVMVRTLSDARPDLPSIAERLANLGQVHLGRFLLRFEAPPFEATLFTDGRAIVKGTTDGTLARSLVARWFGV